jgi:guanylate kinase
MPGKPHGASAARSTPAGLFVLSAPSGAGKSTLVRRLLAARPSLRLSVSHSTRAPRPNEEDGVSYHFVDEPTFRALIAEDAFVEWAEVHGNLYGTSWNELERHAAEGHDVICDIDVQGAAAIRGACPHATSIFVIPPSWAELEARLRGRRTEPEEVVQRRLTNAVGETRQALEYDYLVTNDDLDTATEDILAVLRAAPLARRCRVHAVAALLAERDAVTEDEDETSPGGNP